MTADAPAAGTLADAGRGRSPPDAARTSPPPSCCARIDWSWLRFAPFSLARLVLLAGAVGVLSQFADDLPIWNEEHGHLARGTGSASSRSSPSSRVAARSAAWRPGSLVSVSGYVVQWWNFRLVREHGSLHLTTGLFTTRSITVEEAKVRGVELTEPVLLRPVGGAELSTLATGVEDGVTEVLPPCPRDVAVVGRARPCWPASRPAHRPARRARAPGPATGLAAPGARRLVLAVAAAVAVWWFDEPWWWPAAVAVAALPLAALVGESSYRHLGHALAGDHLVAGSGALARIRTVLETDGIIGWVSPQSWWQRRIGLADLAATTAAGAERVLVRDVRLDVAVALADRGDARAADRLRHDARGAV